MQRIFQSHSTIGHDTSALWVDPSMNRYLTVGLTVLVGAAVIEAALIPGVVIGAAALLAPRVLRGGRPRPAAARQTKVAATQQRDPSTAAQPSNTPARFKIGQALAKTITFRIVVTTLDFTTNYLVIGELSVAAGLSAFNLVGGPLFYLAHEAAWNARDHGRRGPSAAHVRLARRASTWKPHDQPHHHQPRPGEDDHVPHHRHRGGPHGGGAGYRHRPWSLRVRFRARSLRLFRPRESVGPFRRIKEAPGRPSAAASPVARVHLSRLHRCSP